MHTLEARRVIREFATLQATLARTFLDTYRPSDLERFTDVRPGEFLVGTDTWRQQRHGAGVNFTGPHDVCVDAHAGLAQAPSGIDAWRLGLYLASLQVAQLQHGEDVYGVTTGDLQTLLQRMTEEGWLRPIWTKGEFAVGLLELV